MRIVKLSQILRRSGEPSEDALHFLHIGKAAGTQIKTLAQSYPGRVITHGHDTALRNLPEDAQYFFSIRDPITRFVSGFYSRKRRGRPVYDVPWSACEEVAFSEFDHANDLAEALFSRSDRGMAATQAMLSIRHTGQNLVSWFFLEGNLLKVRPPFWILRQEHFEQDYDSFLKKAGLEKPLRKSPSQRAHANVYDDVPVLSEKAKNNLRQWYAQDYAFYDVCEAWLSVQP